MVRPSTLRRSTPTWLADPSLLHAAELTLGRAPDCELVFCDDTVSRHHARLELRDAEVRAGDRIRLGATRFTL